ncbi:ATP-binding cassette domain-containing protein [Nakamurella lactea]|uniref:ATP-binding cassette domain-containing protein n=1 Tax=Nakamurella lactea TaxID=459515 RepID=UPI0006872D4B|nr:ATP-binding cassette domain-containing protein [Nakamurella lactea]
MSEALVEITGLTKDFGQTRAVDNASFAIRRGETFGLVGESGSGKSTIASMLLCLTKPTAGEIFFHGKRIDQLSTRELAPYRKDMQLVMQDPISSLNRRKKVQDIIGLPLALHHGLPGGKRTDRIVQLLELVGLSADYLSRYPHELSGGQCQRVSIARSLSINPEFLVLDESVSAVDVLIQAQILNLLNNLQDEFGLTYLFVSHDLAVVRYMCDRIAVMQAGRILEVSDRDDIFSPRAHEYTRALIAASPASLAAKASTTPPLQMEKSP